jgi:hypothetical protein
LGDARMRKEYLLLIVVSVIIVLGLDWRIDAHKKVVTAKKFQIVDKTGLVRSELALSSDENPKLCFWDKSQDAGIFISQTDTSVYLVFRDTLHNTRGELSLFNDENTRVAFWDKEGKAGIALSLIDNGPALSLFDGEILLATFAYFKNSGWPVMTLADHNGTPRLVLTDLPESGPSMWIYDKNSNPIWSTKK